MEVKTLFSALFIYKMQILYIYCCVAQMWKHKFMCVIWFLKPFYSQMLHSKESDHVKV